MPKTAIPTRTATKRQYHQRLTGSRFGLFLARRRGPIAGFRALAAITLADSDAALSNSSNSARIWGVAFGAARESVTVSVKISRSGGISRFIMEDGLRASDRSNVWIVCSAILQYGLNRWHTGPRRRWHNPSQT